MPRRLAPLLIAAILVVVIAGGPLVWAATSSRVDESQDYVDATSNLHDPADLGTHSSFAELQDYDGGFDTLTEADTAGGGATPIDVQMKQDETNTTSALTGYKCKLAHVFTPVTAGYYLIIAMATGKTSSTSGACYIRLYVAGTGYSEGIIYVANAYQYMTFCAIKRLSLSSSTNISICFRSSSASYTASIWDARIFATNATIEQYAEAETRTTDVVISSWTNKTSITVTPATTGDYWILADGIFDGSSGTYSTFYRVVTKNLTVMVDCLREVQNAAARFSLGFSRVIHRTGGTSDNVVVQFDTENAGNTAGANWVHIAALRTDQFANTYYVESTSEYTPAGAGTWYDTVTKTYTPAAGVHLVIGCINEKTGSTTAASGYVQTRLNLGSGTDLKDTDKWLSKDTTDYMAFFKFYNRTMVASSRTDALQYLGGSTSARVKTPRLLILELTGAAPPSNYRLDLEVGWSSADYDETVEYLCLYGGTQDAEALQVDLWTGAWTTVISDVVAGQWNNVSISSYLTDATVELRFVDTTQVGDTSQNTWQVEAVLLHVYSYAYSEARSESLPITETGTPTPTFAGELQECFLYDLLSLADSVNQLITRVCILSDQLGLTATVQLVIQVSRSLFDTLALLGTTTTAVSSPIILTLFDWLGVLNDVLTGLFTGGGGGGDGGGAKPPTLPDFPPILLPINGAIAFVFLIVGFRLLTGRRRTR